jgi:hypothetical protein
MRYLAAALVLAACASDPVAPVTDAGADTGPTADLGADAETPGDLGAGDAGSTIDAPSVTDTGPTTDASEDAGAVDTGTDVVRVDGAPCIPACAAGSVCVGGVCEAVDGGADAGAVDAGDSGPAIRPMREPREFQSCEPPGASCGGDGGVTCVRSEWLREDAGASGTCLRSCTTGVDAQCPEGSTCLRGACVILCSGDGDCGDAGTRCRDYSIDRACL